MKARHKLLLILVAASLAATVLIALGSIRLVRVAVEDRYLERIGVELEMLAQRIPPAGDATALQAFVRDNGSRLGYRVTLVDESGTVLADSAQDATGLARMDDHSGRPEIREAMREGFGQSRRTSRTTETEYVYVARRVDGSGPTRILRAALPTYQISTAHMNYLGLIVTTCVAAFGLLGTVSYFAVRRLSKPIEDMTIVAEKVAEGDREVVLTHESGDEIGRLADAVRGMRRVHLAEVERLEAEHRLLSSIVAGIQEGLLLVGPDLRVRMTNSAFRRTFSIDLDPRDRLLAEVIRLPRVIEGLEGLIKDGEESGTFVVRAPHGEHAFEVHASMVPGEADDEPSQVLALFFDITRLEALENVRQEFLADASHELRTPLTSIRAFVETLLDGGIDDPDNRGQFLQVIERQSNYMGDLIDDLTDLSRIETGAIELDRTPVDLDELARDVSEQIRQRYRSSDVEIDVRFEEPPLTVRVDRRRMEQVLVNLLDNAVKFNRPGGAVRVRGGRDGATAWIEVEDDGVGIPSESLPKIFNRFYRVDKARSRDVAGTGLGLSIVKHLMRMHGGSVRVESEYGSGTKFILEVPLGPVEVRS